MNKVKDIIRDSSFIERLMRRDKNAFEYLYDRYAGALLGVIVTMTKDQDIAETILQEVYLKIWAELPSYNCDNCCLLTWLLCITKRHTLDAIQASQQDKIIEFKQHPDSNDDGLTLDFSQAV